MGLDVMMVTAASLGSLVVVAVLYVHEERRHEREMKRLRAVAREHHAALLALYQPTQPAFADVVKVNANAHTCGHAILGYYRDAGWPHHPEDDAAFLRSIGVAP